MTLFWLIAAAMALAAGALILIPLWRGRSAEGLSQDEADTLIFRQRLAELSAERQAEGLDAEQYRQLREELERTLLTDVAGAPRPAPASRWPATLATVAALFILVVALGYYYQAAYRGETQNWLVQQDRWDQVVAQAIREPAALPAAARQDPAGFARALQARVLHQGMTHPDSLYLLGVSYIQQQQWPEALEVLGLAYELEPQRADISVAYAQAMILTGDQRLSQAGGQLLHAVLAAQPDNPAALMLLGFSAFNTGAYDQAIDLWQRLLTQRDPASEGARLLRNSIARAEALRAEQAAEAAPAASPGLQITVTVELTPALRAQLAPADALFVFARAENGPPMPLAAVRQPARDFPAQVTLDDQQAVTPALTLSAFPQVVVGARIARGGGASVQAGDWEAAPVAVTRANGSAAVTLVIDRPVADGAR